MVAVGLDFRRPGLILLTACLTIGSLLRFAAGPSAAREPAESPAAGSATADAFRPPKGIADLKALEQAVRKTVAEVAPSVVYVTGGSGVVVSSDGYVLTVAHVAKQAGRSVVVVFPDGRSARAVTLGNDFGVDAGMVKILGNGPWPHAELGGSEGLKPGQWCLTLGYPVSFEHGNAPAVRIGRVLRNAETEIITDCTIMGGDSGAPLFDLDGKVIGIGTMCDPALVHNIHVPIQCYRDDWASLAEGEDFNSLATQRAILGVIPAEGTEEPRIGSVVPGSGAEKGGVKAGDVFLKFAGRELHKYEDLPPLIQQHEPGDKVEVEIRRGGATLKLQLTLGQGDPGDDE
jgi:S1-C subfamily serine protease